MAPGKGSVRQYYHAAPRLACSGPFHHRRVSLDSMKRFGLILTLGLAAGNTAGAQFKAATLPVLDDAASRALAAVVKNIRAEPGTITLHVGQSVQLSTINVIVVDSAGKDRGRLIGFDFGIPKGAAAEAVPRQITGKRPGTAVLTIHYPTTAWKARSDPRAAATVKIDVQP
jgi:hypothetical protein